LNILKDRGLTCVRLRLFTSSPPQAAADPYDYANNLSYSLALAVRAKSAGLQLLLDFQALPGFSGGYLLMKSEVRLWLQPRG